MTTQTEQETRALVRAKRRTTHRSTATGAVAVEYAFLLVIVALPVIVALAAAGLQLISGYGNLRNTILHVGP